MGRKIPVSWDEIPDMEPIDADGRIFQITIYSDGRWTIDDMRTEPAG